jgi:hypothetical protein
MRRTVLDAKKELERFRRENRVAVIEQRRAEAQKVGRERSGTVRPDYGASVTGAVKSKNQLRMNVIPPLFAPNDPKIVQEEDRRIMEKRKQQKEYHKRNADLVLLDYTVQPSPRKDAQCEVVAASHE